MAKYIRQDSIPIIFDLWKMTVPIRNGLDIERITIHKTLNEVLEWLDIIAIDISEIKESEEKRDNNSEERV